MDIDHLRSVESTSLKIKIINITIIEEPIAKLSTINLLARGTILTKFLALYILDISSEYLFMKKFLCKLFICKRVKFIDYNLNGSTCFTITKEISLLLLLLLSFGSMLWASTHRCHRCRCRSPAIDISSKLTATLVTR